MKKARQNQACNYRVPVNGGQRFCKALKLIARLTVGALLISAGIVLVSLS